MAMMQLGLPAQICAGRKSRPTPRRPSGHSWADSSGLLSPLLLSCSPGALLLPQLPFPLGSLSLCLTSSSSLPNQVEFADREK